MKKYPFILTFLIIISACNKEDPTCQNIWGADHNKTARKMVGTWDIVEVKNDSMTLKNTGEQFTFSKCKNPDRGGCDGSFKTANGNKETFTWALKGNTFNINNYDTNSLISNYATYYMSHIPKCPNKELIFKQSNRTITLEKH